VSQPITALRDRRPLSLRVYFELRERIAHGEYLPGSRLPSEVDLARAFAVSRVTVREALRLLQRDGLVKAQHGRGHFVLKPGLIREPVTELRSVTELLTSLGYKVESEVLAAVSERAGKRSSALGIDPDERVTRIERLRSSRGMVLIYSIDVLPTTLLEGVEYDHKDSLFAALAAAGVDLVRAQATIRAAKLPREIARRSGLPLSIPCLLLEQVHFDREDRPLLWSLDYHRGDVFEFNVLRQRLHA
jgi:GntR family transcriptional regulator